MTNEFEAEDFSLRGVSEFTREAVQRSLSATHQRNAMDLASLALGAAETGMREMGHPHPTIETLKDFATLLLDLAIMAGKDTPMTGPTSLLAVTPKRLYDELVVARRHFPVSLCETAKEVLRAQKSLCGYITQHPAVLGTSPDIIRTRLVAFFGETDPACRLAQHLVDTWGAALENPAIRATAREQILVADALFSVVPDEEEEEAQAEDPPMAAPTTLRKGDTIRLVGRHWDFFGRKDDVVQIFRVLPDGSVTFLSAGGTEEVRLCDYEDTHGFDWQRVPPPALKPGDTVRLDGRWWILGMEGQIRAISRVSDRGPVIVDNYGEESVVSITGEGRNACLVLQSKEKS